MAPGNFPRPPRPYSANWWQFERPKKGQSFSGAIGICSQKRQYEQIHIGGSNNPAK